MTSVLRIVDGEERKEYRASALPLAIGVSIKGRLVIGRMAESDPAVWLELNDQGMFLQPVSGSVTTRFNGKVLDHSTWLHAGDVVQIGMGKLVVGIDEGVVVLSPIHRRKVPALTPPSSPPSPAVQTQDSKPLRDDHVTAHEKPATSEQSETRSEIETPATFTANAATLDAGQTQDESPPSAEQTLDTEKASGATKQSPRHAGTTEDFARLPGTRGRSRLRNAIILVFVLLLSGVALVLLATPLEVAISPTPDSIQVLGFPPPLKVKDRYLAVPGSYEVVAEKEGYHPLQESFKVEYGSDLSLAYNLLKLPGLLDIDSQPVNGAKVRIDGHVVGETPLSSIELEAGNYELEINAERYLPATETVEIQGMGNQQSIEVQLQPGWGSLHVDSEPKGTDVWLNEISIGQTPLHIEPMGGDYHLVLKKDGWKTIQQEIRIEPGNSLSLPKFSLQRLDGVLELTSEPPGALVTIDNEFRGNTPITQAILSGQDHELRLSMSGFVSTTQAVRIEGGETKNIHISMVIEYGTVFVICNPADAKLTVDGDEVWPSSKRLRLSTLPHKIDITREGYEPYSASVTPTAGVPKRLDVPLRRKPQVVAKQQESKTAEGQNLTRIVIRDQVRFQMGSSRREPHRRSDEGFYMVELTRSFDVSEKEVTNSEFQRFQPEHNSGNLDGVDLNEPDQPATSVTWNDAAAYLNWLSQKDGLPPAYKEEDGTMIPVTPTTSGYRLMTEAEWAFVTRYDGGNRESPIRYPWGEGPVPSKSSGNYADMNAKNTVPLTIEDYYDGFQVAAPVGSFPIDKLGFYDLGGNVSEWCHDYYDVQVGNDMTPLRDPTGPAHGVSHVVRGASWRHGSITDLRLTSRNFSESSRDDLGFRIARYAEK